MATSLIAWRNWCFEHGSMFVDQGVFETSAPEDNMLDPRTGSLAILESPGFLGAIEFGCSWTNGRPVHLIALLNVNIVDYVSNAIAVTVEDSGGGAQSWNVPVYPFFSAGFQRHFIFELTNPTTVDLDLVDSVRINMNNSNVQFGSFDPYTGIVTNEPFQCGGIWAGPIWRPTNGIKFGAFGQGITENLRGAVSIGGQFYPNPQPRQRTSSFDFALLSEPEVYSVDVDQPSLQQLGAWCARSRPLIVIPVDESDDLNYAQGMYGYLTADPQWNHVEASQTDDVDEKVRVYAGGVQMIEAL